MATTPQFENVPVVGAVQIANADGTTKKTLLTGSTNGTRVDGVLCSSNDTAVVNLQFFIRNGATSYLVGLASVPANTGYAAATPRSVDAINYIAPVMPGAIILPSGYVLEVAPLAAVTAAKVVDVVAFGGNF